jgi:hypothetical protein
MQIFAGYQVGNNGYCSSTEGTIACNLWASNRVWYFKDYSGKVIVSRRMKQNFAGWQMICRHIFWVPSWEQ